MKTNFVFLGIIFFVLLHICSSQHCKAGAPKKDSVAFSESQHIITVEGQLSDGRLVQFRIERASLPSNMPYPMHYWGNVGQRPRFVISNIQATVGKKALWVSLSAFCDLAEPNYVTLIFTGKKVKLKIDGSQTGEHYIAEIEFEENRLIRRLVWATANPKQSWEETRYSFPIEN